MKLHGAVVTRVRPLSSERAVPVLCLINEVRTVWGRSNKGASVVVWKGSTGSVLINEVKTKRSKNSSGS